MGARWVARRGEGSDDCHQLDLPSSRGEVKMLERIRARRAWAAGALATAAAIVLLLILGSAGGGVAAGAQSRPLVTDSATLAPISPTIPSKETCASIATLASLAGLPHYPTAIASAHVVAAAGREVTPPPHPDHCHPPGKSGPPK